jgi:hypothetical protein
MRRLSEDPVEARIRETEARYERARVEMAELGALERRLERFEARLARATAAAERLLATPIASRPPGRALTVAANHPKAKAAGGAS